MKQVKKQKLSEKIENRVLINFAIGAGAYIWLFLLSEFYMKPALVIPTAIVLLVGAILCYIFDKKTGKTKNYGHALLGISLAAAFCNTSFILSKIFGAETVLSWHSNPTTKMLLNSKTEGAIVAWLGGIYLFVVTVVNLIKLARLKKR